MSQKKWDIEAMNRREIVIYTTDMAVTVARLSRIRTGRIILRSALPESHIWSIRPHYEYSVSP